MHVMGSLHENGPPRNSKNLNFFLSQNTFICIHICKQVFKVTESEFFHKSIKNCKNGNLMKFKYKKKMVPYVTQAYSGITVGDIWQNEKNDRVNGAYRHRRLPAPRNEFFSVGDTSTGVILQISGPHLSAPI